MCCARQKRMLFGEWQFYEEIINFQMSLNMCVPVGKALMIQVIVKGFVPDILLVRLLIIVIGIITFNTHGKCCSALCHVG